MKGFEPRLTCARGAYSTVPLERVQNQVDLVHNDGAGPEDLEGAGGNVGLLMQRRGLLLQYLGGALAVP
jgi:hypothetical protein